MRVAIENDLLHLMVILQSIGKILKYSAEFHNADDFYCGYDQMAYNASLTLFMRIRKRIMLLSSYKAKTTEYKLRDVLVNIDNLLKEVCHYKFIKADHHKIYKIIQDELPKFKEVIEYNIRKNITLKFFDINELYVYKENGYYDCVDFDNLVYNDIDIEK